MSTFTIRNISIFVFFSHLGLPQLVVVWQFAVVDLAGEADRHFAVAVAPGHGHRYKGGDCWMSFNMS